MTRFKLHFFSGTAGIMPIGKMTLLFHGCKPISNFQKTLSYEIRANLSLDYPQLSRGLKNIILIADSKGTEIFDLLGPFYLFSETRKANVFIVILGMVSGTEAFKEYAGKLIIHSYTDEYIFDYTLSAWKKSLISNLEKLLDYGNH